MRGSGGHAGDGLAVRLARALASAPPHASTLGVVVMRLLPARESIGQHALAASQGQPQARAELLAALAEYVRRHLRAEDELIHDPLDGLALLIWAASPATALLVAERLRDTLGAPLARPRRSRRKIARATPRDADSAREGDYPDGDTMVRLVLGYATAEVDADSADALIRAAWRPRMLLSVSPAALLVAATQATSGASRSTELPDETGASLEERREPRPATGGGEEREMPVLREPVAVVGDAEPTVGPGDGAKTAGGGSVSPHLRLVPREGISEQEADTLRRRAGYLGVPYMRLPRQVDATAARAIPAALARELRAVPLGRNRFVLTVAMEHPNDANALLHLRAATGLAIFPVLAAADEIERLLNQLD